MADCVVVAHAAPGSATWALCQILRDDGRSLVTLDDPENDELIAAVRAVCLRARASVMTQRLSGRVGWGLR
jgi:hypothetical protein